MLFNFLYICSTKTKTRNAIGRFGSFVFVFLRRLFIYGNYLRRNADINYIIKGVAVEKRSRLCYTFVVIY